MESIKVKDLMLPVDQYTSVSQSAPLYEAVLALETALQIQDPGYYRHGIVLIRDIDNRIVGKLTLQDLFMALEPAYGAIGDLRQFSGFGLKEEFLRSIVEKYELWKAPLDDICRKSANATLNKVVATPLDGEFIEQAVSINRAVHQMLIGRHETLLVTSEREVVGVLHLKDVFREVCQRMKACRI